MEKERRPTFSQMKLRLKSIGISLRRDNVVRDKNQEHIEEDVYINNDMGPAEGDEK